MVALSVHQGDSMAMKLVTAWWPPDARGVVKLHFNETGDGMVAT